MKPSSKHAAKSATGAREALSGPARAPRDRSDGQPSASIAEVPALPQPPRRRPAVVPPPVLASPLSLEIRRPNIARRAVPPFARRAVLEQLEPRFLLSADLNPLAGDALFIGPSLQPAEFRSITEDSLPRIVTTFAVAPPPVERTSEIVFVDTATPDYQNLVDDMRGTAQREGRGLEFVLIDAETDGLARITETLAQRSNVDAIHIISHARGGAVQLGGAELDLGAVAEHAGRIGSWGLALTADADILFYGCDLAATAEGKALVETIARLTGADVTGSDDRTGNAQLGGDWTLEYATGRIEAEVAVSAAAQQAWMATLAPEVLDFDAVTWPGGLSASYAVGPGNVSLTVSGSTGQLNNGAPTINNTNTGGLNPVQDGLFLSADFNNTAQSITLTIAFTQPGGVSNVSFSVFDIDTGNFVDQVVVTGNDGATINPTSVVVGSLVTFDGVNTVTGTSGTTGDARSNARFTFNQAGITSITLLYRPGPGSPANPDQQYITVHDISFASALGTPQVDLNASDASPFAGEAFGTATYDNASTGAIPWNGNWAETDAAGGAQSPTAGNVLITGGELRMTQSGSVIQRAVNLGAYTADNINRLSFNYRTNNAVDAGSDQVFVEVSSNGGSSWTALDTLDLGANASGSASYDITAFSNANTVVRFRTTGFASGTAEYFYLDDVAVSAQPTGHSATYTENGAAVSIANADAYINDDSANMSSMSITIASVVAGDALTWTNQAGIAASYNAGTGVLTASGAASRANYQALLRSVQFSSTSDDPTVNGTRMTRAISVVVTDSSSNVSNTARSTITIAAVNDAPVIGGAGSTRSYTENAAAVTLEPVLTVTDADDTQIVLGSVTVSAGFTTGDTLTWTNQPGISASYDGATGVLSLSGVASLATYQALLGSVAYSSTSDAPTAISASRTITWSLTDANSDGVGAATGTATTMVNLTAINDPPVNTVPGAQATVVSVPLVFSSANGNLISVADAEAGTIQVTLAVTSGTLTLSGTAGLSFAFSDGNGTGVGDGTADALMTFRGSQAAVNVALAGLSFVSASVGSPTLTITTSDLGAAGTGGTLTDTDTVAIAVLPGTVLDLDSTPTDSVGSSSATSNLVQNGDFSSGQTNWTEGGSSSGSVGGTGNRFIWTSNATATLSQSITLPTNTSSTTYSSNGTTLTQTTVATTNTLTSISFDFAWQNSSGGTSNTFEVLYNNVLYATFSTSTTNWTSSGGASIAPGSVGAVGNEANGGLTNIVITLPAGVTANASIQFSYVGGSDDIAIDNVAVTNTATTATAVTTVDLVDTGWTATYTENGPAVAIADTDSSIFDADSANMVSATITLTNPQTGDRLLVSGSAAAGGTLPSGIAWARTDTLVTFSASFDKASYAGAIELIQFENTTDNPSTTARTIAVVVNDGTANSNTAIATVDVTAAADPPVITSNGGGATANVPVAENTTTVTDVDATDPDSPTLTYSIVGGADAALFTINSSTGVLTFLAVPDFEAPADAGADNVYDLIVQVSDGSLTDTQAIAVTVTNVNEPPVISDATVALDENSANGTVVYDLNDGGNDTDADGTALTYTITAGNGAGGFAIDLNTGVITVANSAVLDFETTPSFVLTVQASDGTLTDTAAITINLNNLNDNAPPVANNVSANGSEDDVSIAITLTGSDANDTVASFRLLGLPGNGVLYTDAGLTSAAVVGVDYAAAGNALTLYLVPASDWNGATAFLFTATDTNGASDVTPATATITVTAVNDPPAATNLSAPETYTEDTLLDLVDIVVSDVDGGNVTVTLTLSDIAAGTLNTATVGGVTSTFVGGVWIASGALADVNALLAGLTFTPAANYNSNFTIATAVSDGAAPPLTGTKVVTGTPVNDAPVLGSNSFAVSDGGTLVLTNGNLSATDVDDAAANLVFTVSGVTNGQFQVLGAPVTTFTQAQLVAGQVQFVHDGSGLAPTFTLEVSDPAAAVDGPYLGNIVFNGGGGGAGGSGGAGGRGVAGSGVGSGGGAVGTSIVLLPSAESAIVPLTFRPDVLPHPLFPLVDPVAQRFLRRPTVESGSGQDVAPASTTAPADTRDEPARQPASRDAAPQELSPPSAAPPVHNQADRVAKPLFDSDRRVEPARAAATVPTRYVPAEKGDAQGTDSIETEVRVMGIVASIGAVESIARATGLVAQLLAGSPTRSRKPPFVLVRAKRRRKRRGAAARTGGRRQPAKRGKPRRSSKR